MARRLPAPAPVLSGYRFVRPLGTGGFADVYLFEQDMPRRSVAVKVLLSEVIDNDVLRMFNAEADVMARLSSHPSILTVYQASISADGRPYLVMEYCPTSLTNRYRREQVPVTEVLQFGVRIGAALETAHRSGVLHRDIKPSNILVTAFGAPVLSDFGIAASLASSTRKDVVAMSVPWSSPEVIEERVIGSVAAEVWSLGATMYSLLAGRSPFEVAGSGMNGRDQLAARIRHAKYVATGRADVPDQLEAVLKKSLSLDPRKRQTSAAEFAHEFQLVQHALGLPHTALEIAADEWAPKFTGEELDDAQARGPVRSSVSYPSKRNKTVSSSSKRAPSPDDVTMSEGGARSISVRAAMIGGAVIAIVVAVAAVALVVILGGA
jgi:serine/threonine protein kinase